MYSLEKKTGKCKTNQFFQIINKHTYLFAAFLTLTIFFIFWGLNGFCIVYESYDDYPFNVFLAHNDEIFLFLGVFLTKILAFFQKIFPFINSHSVFSVFAGLLSFSILDYVLLKKFSSKIGLFLAILFNLLFTNITIINLQFTEVAGSLSLAATAILIYSVICEKRKKYIILQLLGGFLLAIWGSQHRYESSIAIFALSFLLCVCVFIRYIFENNETKWIKRLRYSFNKSFKLFLVIVFTAACCFSVNLISNTIKNNNGFSEFSKYNTARSLIQDYPIAVYEGNEEFYNSVDVFSPDDFLLLTCFKFDKDMYTIDKLEKIEEYALNHNSGKQNIYLAYFQSLQNKVQNICGNEMFVYPTIGVLSIAAFLFALIVFKLRNKIKPLFTIAYIVIWVLVAFYYRNIYNIFNDTFFVVLLAFSIVIAIIGNRYQYINIALFTASTIIIFNYMIYTRIAFRAEYTFIVPSVYFIIMLFEQNDIRASVQKTLLKLPKMVICALICAFALTLVIFVQYKSGVFFSNIKDTKYDVDLAKYINNNPNDIFFFDFDGCELLDHSKVDPFAVSDEPENAIQYGGWTTSSFFYEKKAKKYNVKMLYQEMINSPNRYFVISKKNTDYAHMLEEYYNSHYKKNKDIILRKVKTTKNAWLYQVNEKQ